MSVIFTGISVTSLADVDAVYSWVQKSPIEPNTWIPLVDRPSNVSSGTIIFSTNPSYSDGVKWNEHTRKGLEKNGNRTLWVVSGLQNTEMKRYSTTVVHHGQKCSLVAYLLDGDNLPSAYSISTPPSQFKLGLPRTNEPTGRQAGGIYPLLTKNPLGLPSSTVERIKSVVEALAVELGVDVHILLSTITEVFCGRLGNMEPGGPLTNCPLSTRETRQALDNVLMPEELPEYGHDIGKRKACDMPVLDEARKKRKTPGRVASGARVSRRLGYGGHAQVFASESLDIGNAAVAHVQPQEGAEYLPVMSSSSRQITSEHTRDARNLYDVMAPPSPWTYYNTSSRVDVSGADNSQYVDSGSFKTVPRSAAGQGGRDDSEGFAPQGMGSGAPRPFLERPPLARQSIANMPTIMMDPLLSLAQYGMDSYTFNEYMSVDYFREHMHLPDNYSTSPNFAMEAICRSSSDAVTSRGLTYGGAASSTFSILSEMTQAASDAGYASNNYPSFYYSDHRSHL